MSCVSLMRSEALPPSDRDVIWPMGAATMGHCQCFSVGGGERVYKWHIRCVPASAAYDGWTTSFQARQICPPAAPSASDEMGSEKLPLAAEATKSGLPSSGQRMPEATSVEGTVRAADLVNGDNGSDATHVFSNPKVADYWRGVYEKAQYECRHRFDPGLIWSADEEKKLRRRVCLTVPFGVWMVS